VESPLHNFSTDACSGALRDECGVFGIRGPGEDVARLTFFGLFSLQHRGQESAGISVARADHIETKKGMGLVNQIFTEETLAQLGRGDMAIGHVRYSTTGGSRLENAQPTLVSGKKRTVAVAHNGNLVNAAEVREQLVAQGCHFSTTTDTELAARLIADDGSERIEEAIRRSCARLKGAYSMVVMTTDALVAVRDPFGIRPLCIGRLNGTSHIFASETCALGTVGAKFVREVEPGEIVVLDSRGLREHKHPSQTSSKFCIFEFIYLARPDSYLFDKNVHMVRRRLGHELAREQPCPQAHLVLPVPDSGIPAAVGFSEATRIPYAEGMIKNRYIHRTFIQPDQRIRDLGVRLKLSPLRESLQGKKVVLVDDSIVRGTTNRQVVAMLKKAGAKEVHVRISSAPYRYACFYGIDTPRRKDLIASRTSVEKIREHLGADSLGYLGIKGMTRATGISRDKFCLACFDGNYCVEIPRRRRPKKEALESQPDGGRRSGGSRRGRSDKKVPAATGAGAQDDD
jgi:amidophosphoribosyltransferase